MYAYSVRNHKILIICLHTYKGSSTLRFVVFFSFSHINSLTPLTVTPHFHPHSPAHTLTPLILTPTLTPSLLTLTPSHPYSHHHSHPHIFTHSHTFTHTLTLTHSPTFPHTPNPPSYSFPPCRRGKVVCACR